MGRKQFEKIVASAPRENLRITTLSATNPLGVGGTDFLDFFAPAGSIGILQSGYWDIARPIGSTSGFHGNRISTTVLYGDFISGYSLFGDPVTFNYKYFQNATSNKTPALEGSQVLAFAGNVFDDTIGLRIIYENQTNVIQTNPRTYKISWIERVRG